MTHGSRSESEKALTTSGLILWCRRTCSATDIQRAHLDEINLIFDPDEDTGTNLVGMWTSLVNSTDRVTHDDPRHILTPSDLLAKWGADDDWDVVGRSTRIMARIFREMAAATHGMPVLDASAFAEMLGAAADIADWDTLLPEAGNQPPGKQPGTMLDVVEAAAEAAQRAQRLGLHAQLSAVAAAADDATTSTPAHHRVLRMTGVVDAGALGLSVALHELQHILRSR